MYARGGREGGLGLSLALLRSYVDNMAKYIEALPVPICA